MARTFSKNLNKEATYFFKKLVIFLFTVVFRPVREAAARGVL